jgi:hypothetical protein
VSLWLSSGQDESTDEEEQTTVVRICIQGRDTNEKIEVRNGFQHHIPYISSSVLLMTSVYRLTCQYLTRRPEFTMKASVTISKHERRYGSNLCCGASRMKNCLRHHDTHSRHVHHSRHPRPALMSHMLHKTCISRIFLVYRKTRSLLCSCVQLIIHGDCLLYNNTKPLLPHYTLQCPLHRVSTRPLSHLN